MAARRSPSRFRRLFQPTQLVRIADGVDPGDQVILDHQTHRGVVASDIETGHRACR